MRNVRFVTTLLLFLLILPQAGLAQDKATDPIMGSVKAIHDITSEFILATAEMLDEDMYAYRPSVNVRTAGQQLAHLANTQFSVCALAAGEESPAEGNYEEIATTREEILTAVKAGFAYCDKVYSTMTDDKATEMKMFLGGENRQEMTISAILSFNSTHNYEHYGNLVTYMRMNGLVPPSSQP